MKLGKNSGSNLKLGRMQAVKLCQVASKSFFVHLVDRPILSPSLRQVTKLPQSTTVFEFDLATLNAAQEQFVVIEMWPYR